jgi:mobilization protein NikA
MSSPPAPERRAAGSDAETRVQAPSRPRSESRQRTALVAVRLLPQERDVLAETARSRGITLSELIRASAMRAASAPAADGEARLPAHSAVPKADRLRELRPRAGWNPYQGSVPAGRGGVRGSGGRAEGPV